MGIFKTRTKGGLVTSQRRQGCAPALLLSVLGLSFLGIGGTALYFVLIQPLQRSLEAQNWVEAQCTITESFLESSEGNNGSTYRPAVRYTYEYREQNYSGSRFGFSDMYTSGHDSQKSRLGPYPVGAQVPCYVNPHQPTDSVIERDLDSSTLIPGLVVSIFPLIGFLILFFAWRSGPKKSALPSHSPRSTPESTARSLAPSDRSAGMYALPSYEEGPKVHTSSPYLRLLFSIFLALFWNGIVSVFIGVFIDEWQSGSPDWFMGLFLLPFIAVGLGLLAFVGHSILGLFNPRMSIEISPHPCPLGDRIDLKWRIEGGSVDKVRSFDFTLSAKEVARYRRGTSTATQTHVFFTAPLRSLQPVELQIRQGRFSFTVPEHLIPSLSLPNNEIVWEVSCHGQIDHWPDIKESVVLTVIPGRSTGNA